MWKCLCYVWEVCGVHAHTRSIYICIDRQTNWVTYYKALAQPLRRLRNSKIHSWQAVQSQFSSVAQSCPTLCDPMNRSTPGLPVHHQRPEFTQTHIHWVSDAIQPSHPLSSPSPLAPNPSQHQSLFLFRRGFLPPPPVLTVREGAAGSHDGIGWQNLTDRVVTLLNEREKPMVFMLWGNYAKRRLPLITNENHLVLTSVHPSPLSASRGFFGCKHFSKANKFLIEHNIAPVDWQGENWVIVI